MAKYIQLEATVGTLWVNVDHVVSVVPLIDKETRAPILGRSEVLIAFLGPVTINQDPGDIVALLA